MDRKEKADSVFVKISNPEKILIPDNISKYDLVLYYKNISKLMLPHLKNRALALERFPNGINGKKFYQKNIVKPPKWLRTFKVKNTNYAVCNNEASLLYLANLASIPFHGWLSRIDKIKNPDKLIFDLDPQQDDLDTLVEAAYGFKFILEKIGMKAFLMSTGSRGLHLVINLDRKSDFSETREFASKVAEFAASKKPNLLTTEMRKEKRKGKIFVDIYRNSFSQLAVVPYSVRAIPGAPVAAPLDWKEIEDFYPKKYTIKNMIKRKEKWKDFFKKEYSIKEADKKFDEIFGS